MSSALKGYFRNELQNDHHCYVRRWVRQVGYSTLVTFQSQDRGAHPIYHTNVMMAVGSSVAVVCGESIADSQQRKHLFVRSPVFYGTCYGCHPQHLTPRNMKKLCQHLFVCSFTLTMIGNS